MAGSCRRLLAFFPLIFPAPIVISAVVISAVVISAVVLSTVVVVVTLSSQEAERLPARDGVTIPILAPKLRPLHDIPPADSSSSAPRGIPPPVLPRSYPVVPGNPGLPRDVFQQLVRTAGIIFSGRVTAVGTDGSSPGPEHAATFITFQVEHAMRGTLPNQSVTIHEWAGLRSRGERYRVGERVLLFLYGPSKLGLTSPVAGPMGRFALDSQDRIVMSAAHIATFAGNPILRGRPVVSYVDFALAVRNAQPEEWIQP
jgi:hypothetical protein